MSAKGILVTVLAVLLVFGVSSVSLAKGPGGDSRGGMDGKGLGSEERTEKKGVEGMEQGKHKGEIKKKKNKKGKGVSERAKPATRAVPTPGTPGAVPAVPATPSK